MVVQQQAVSETLAPPGTWRLDPAQAPPAADRRALWIEVPDEVVGLDLIERLGPLVHSELAPLGDGCCRVAVEVREERVDAVVIRVLEVVPAWAAAHGIQAARLELDGRVAVLDSSAARIVTAVAAGRRRS